MSCRFSGIATSPEGLWQMLSKGLTGWATSGKNRFCLESFWHPQSDLNGSFNTRGFHLLNQDPALFDVAYEAFEDAGIPLADLAGSDTAVYCAVSHHDYEKILGRDPEVSPKKRYRFTGTGPSILANRVSYFFDLHGPSMAIDTACSSGLVAIHQACQSIRTGEAKQALVGGVNLILDPDQVSIMSSMSFLSAHGRCYSFDSRADGEAQMNMINKVYKQAGLNPSDTAYVEAHGTGTTVGDKLEAAALRDTFCKNRRERTTPLLIGSVKANIGHTESVAGLAGQGAQWAGMACGLLSTSPVFKQSMQRSEETLLQLGANWQLIQELSKQDGSRINEAELSQPVCTAVQVGLVDMLAAWNVFPAGVVGHSSGEIAAAYAVGMLSAEDALSVAYHRGMHVRRLKELYPDLHGAMLAAGISAADAQAYLVDDPSAGKAIVACENSPCSVTISGDEKAVSIVQGKLAADQLFNRSLVVEAAYHSHHMELVQELYWASIQNVQCSRRRRDVHMISSVYGEEVQDADLDAHYWCKNLTSPVRFADALAKLLRLTRDKDQGAVVIVEIGPHSALADYLSVLVRKQDASNTAITAAGRLFQLGYVSLDLDTINDPHGNAEKRILSDLPRYGWTHKTEHWSESRRSAKYRLRKFPRHDLLGTAAMDSLSEEPTWRNYLRLQEQPWLVGHSIGGSIVFPAAGYLVMALEALKQATLQGSKPWKNLRVMFQNYQQSHCIHPSTLDLCFQSAFLIMKTAGLLGSSTVVASINSLELHTEIPSKPGQELHVSTKLQQHGRSKVITDTAAGTSQRPEGESLTHRIEWSIDADLADSGTVIKHCQLEQAELMLSGPNRICEEYAKILVQQTIALVERIEGEQLKINGHFVKLLEWMRAVSSTNPPATATAVNATVVKNLEEQVKATGALGEMLVHIGPHLIDVLQGDTEALGLLQEDDRLYGMYSYENYDRCHRQLAKYVQLLQFKNPNLRILEIGARTASTTVWILEALSAASPDSSGRPKLGGYTFTDISSGFFAKAQDKLSKYGELMEFQKLDIEQPPAQQGIQLGSYDLIIATNVLHATRDVGNTLHNVRSLLKSGGRLALLEFTVPTVHTGLIFGMLPGWWLSDDGRKGGPLDVSTWDESLRCCGFSGVEVELPDFYTRAEHELSLLISTAGQEERPLDVEPTVSDDLNTPDAGTVATTISSSSPPKEEFDDGRIVHIVHGESEERVADHLTKLFRGVKIPAKKIDLATCQVDYGQPVVVLLEVKGPFLAICSESEWERVRQLCHLSTVVLWVTAGAAIESSNPMSSLITGLSRCLRSEDHSTRFITLDLEAKSDLEQTLGWELAACRCIFKISQRVFHGPDTKREPLIEEWEYAIREDEILIPRLVADHHMDSYIRDSVSHYHPRQDKKGLRSGRALGLNIHMPGLLDTLYWEDSDRHSRPVGSEEVRVELDFISLNFKDVMTAMGQLGGHLALLLEGSGRVVEIGEGASGMFAVGDAVYVLDFDGVATTSNIHCSNVHRMPPDVNLEMPAAVGIAYATAYYSLVSRGHLQAGERVLIHSGAGAVGQAAITLAQKMCEAGEIFVTVGSDEKREFVKNRFGIPEENIFSSRGLDFYQGILQRTAGEGVDVVLNSLSGESLQKSVQLLSPLGRFVEIGKKDLLSSESRLEMRHLERNIQFSTVDLTLLGRRQPAQLREIFATVLDLVTRDKIAIINPIKAKSISETEETFRLMQAGQHMGKLLLRVDPEAYIPVQPPKPTAGAMVSGTWNIHEVFGDTLDFFVLFSSSGGIIGSFGQGNYCAGNTFQDAFARYRTGMGLPGRSIDIGFVEGEGYTAENEVAADFVRRQGLTSYRLQEFLVTVEEAIKRPVGAAPAEAQLLCGISRADPASSSQEAALQRPDPKFSHIWRKQGAASQDQRTSAASASQIDVQAALRSCTSAAEASEMTLQAVKMKLARLLAVPAKDILVDRSVASHGMDSLVAVELRNWISAFLEAHVQTVELMSSMSFTNLALLIAKRSHLIQPRVFAD
ncbi:acyl transferase domain-containing protein [Hirsutella rhossiliensis]|uniref:Acyl transferase domain-containing protein n=1 Tax=Hirsutella rhossiliensis TaxID=111463 RepID=A0A9P8N3C2_9HYPO|nr:acyl transferase domain-containing protein [Hirsutella rhossiliensis]KAH0966913.1 acyl transferase domain-containing protein [Hirsutella rhossiliensis]